MKPQIESAIERVLLSGHFILGPEVAQFEKEFSRFTHTRFGIGVACGTDALELSLRALGVGPGHLVATVSFTFLATVDAILQVGARPLFVDIDSKSYTMDPADLEVRLRRLDRRMRRQVKAVIPVHLYGHPCDMDQLGAIARRYQLAVIEDSAQAAGAQWRGRAVGSFGDVGCFSFFPSKSLGAFGDGGLVVTDSARCAERLRRLRGHGRGSGERQLLLGRNSRLDELQAAILRVKLRALKGWVAKRRSLAKAYHQQLARIEGVRCPVSAVGAHHAFTLYVIRAARRSALLAFLQKRGIGARVYYATPVHRQPLYRKMFPTVALPKTDRAAQEVVALPLYPELRENELARVCDSIRRFYTRA